MSANPTWWSLSSDSGGHSGCANTWLTRDGGRIALIGGCAIGIFLLARGVISLLT
jgi:hypothetical protein